MTTIRQSRMMTLQIEVQVDWDEDEHGTKTFLGAQCQTRVPFTVATWAETMAWQQLCGVRT